MPDCNEPLYAAQFLNTIPKVGFGIAGYVATRCAHLWNLEGESLRNITCHDQSARPTQGEVSLKLKIIVASCMFNTMEVSYVWNTGQLQV